MISEVAQAGAIDQLRAFSATTKSASGDFTQRVTSRTQKVSVPNTGTFVFARPGKFRWTYLKPYEQMLVADGEKLTIYDKDLNQVTTKKLTDALGSTPAAVLFGNADIEKQFDLKEAGTIDGVDWLDAIPKAKDSNFERIRIGFQNGELAAMELHDVLGQVTLLNFNRLQRNPVISPDAFKFTPPAGVDVLAN
jgi:outer membrane lipoprotein carrier protein